MTWCSFWKIIVFLRYFKNKLVASKELIASTHFPSSTKLIGAFLEKICICFFILISSVSWGQVLVCWINVFVCFLIKSNNSIILQVWQVLLLQKLHQGFEYFSKHFCLNYEEVIFFVLFGLLSFFCLFTFWDTSCTVINSYFCNVIYFKENINNIKSSDSINSKQQFQNLFLTLLSSRFFKTHNYHKIYHFFESDIQIKYNFQAHFS